MVLQTVFAELVTTYNKSNPFYGNRKHKQVINDVFETEFDRREDIAPFGVRVKVKEYIKGLDEFCELTISANRYAFEDNRVILSFGEWVYELYISFTEDKKSIEYIVLDKWNEMVNFEDSEEPSVSWNEDKIEFEIIYD